MTFSDRDLVSDTPKREDRRAHLVRGTLQWGGGKALPIIIRNMSERGLGVTCKEKPPLRGEAVVITLPGAPELDGVVRWVRGTDFGVLLSDAVDTVELATAIRNEIARIKDEANWRVSKLHRVQTPRYGPARPI